MTQVRLQVTPLPASHPFNVMLAAQRARALAALSDAKRADGLFDPLRYLAPKLQRYQMLASEELGDRGFVVDENAVCVLFNSHPIERITSHISSRFAALAPNELASLIERGVGLYLYHELFHLEQNFEDHQLAAIIKNAFGPDDLSKIDVYADIIAAHCQSLVDLSGSKRDIEQYFKMFGANVTLSYEILSGAFESKSPHKKRRGLGLMTSRLLVERAANSNFDEGYVEEALVPVYTSIALESSHIIALATKGSGWVILFYAHVTDSDKLVRLWDRAGTADPEELLRLLYAAIGDVLD